MPSLPTDTVPAAEFILRHMYRPLDLAEGGVPPGPDRSMAAPHRSDQLVHHVRPQRQALDQPPGAPARDRGARQARAQPAQAHQDFEEPFPLLDQLEQFN